MISCQSKNDMMDKYYTLRELDRSLQLMFRYEDKNELSDEIIVDYMQRRHSLILQIYALLLKLNLPSRDLMADLKDKGLAS